MPKDTFFNLNKEKQEKIMRTAVSEFSNNGFENANIGNIAKNASVAKGSMYQYFENKKELFLFSLQWSLELVMNKYGKYLVLTDDNINIFDYLYESSKDVWSQINDEREVIIFIQDVFLGKYNHLTNESMKYIMKVSDEYILKIVQDGKRNGSIRTDIDDEIIALFITGVSMKIKERMMNRARAAGEDIVDESFGVVEKDIKSMIELLKNGLGTKL
ncbi:TetR/AcrR family transcriptional regulator [Clostridium folliculivorans]|uniref:AcrR family transcriptional regulator n=1 Tax=Clostridium folliculivorans TaxID=2886038 RepID=A0A9W5Y3J7_9CLOT|nr:TetR/AcrR family transcriptional regulator [Clostridium folliculivorans]GKU25912.1 AcrR family transcriptional regulator [Clostridium folliculivorans]GKU27998.1 AcrR family transcriptional regulator [Clostridium folliculivorans]